MKTGVIILWLVVLTICLTSCTAEPIESNQSNNSYKQQYECGTIVGMGDEPNLDYIDVRFDWQNSYEKNRYKVNNYADYTLGKKICDFSGLQQIEY